MHLTTQARVISWRCSANSALRLKHTGRQRLTTASLEPQSSPGTAMELSTYLNETVVSWLSIGVTPRLQWFGSAEGRIS